MTTRGVLTLVLAAAAAQERDAPEYEIKAAFLYNFATFVEWPPASFAGPESPFQVGVLGQDPFGRVLEEAFAGKTVHNRRIVIRRSSEVGDLAASHLLFVCTSERERAPKDLEFLKGVPVLMVGEFPGFATMGGCINFFIEGKKVRFEVNLEAAKRANLKVSSKLLRLARVVEVK
jgi:hypothetical protein